ncbi:MAG: hypothetical protein RL748_1364 [Pseudomonadota bacterium]|jgi:hypothetical protein
MKKLLALVLAGVVFNAVAATEVRYYTVPSNYTPTNGDCNARWPGSVYNGMRMGGAGYAYLSCRKDS